MDQKWIDSLASRNNLIYHGIPYVPILVENISSYVSTEDFEYERVKTIQTIGEINSATESRANVLTLTPGNNSQFLISLAKLSINEKYEKGPNNIHTALWDKYSALRVYGRLVKQGTEILLEVHMLIPVHDVAGSWNMLKLLSGTARTKLQQYFKTQKENHVLETQWLYMKEQKLRLVKEERKCV